MRSKLNLYVHYDAVTNHVMTRAIPLKIDDFDERFFPKNLILAESPPDFGRFDSQTNFKVLRGKAEVRDYMLAVQKENLRISNWIDFEDYETMRLLTPNEIAEILYLFHANKSLRAAFFYKLQNNYVFLTLPNGLNKTFYRHVTHFYPRLQRVLHEQMMLLVNEDRSLFFMRKEKVNPVPQHVVESISPLFSNGLKINFTQSYVKGSKHYVPLDIIEDQLTLLTLDQQPSDHVGFLMYDGNSQQWQVELELELN